MILGKALEQWLVRVLLRWRDWLTETTLVTISTHSLSHATLYNGGLPRVQLICPNLRLSPLGSSIAIVDSDIRR